MWTIEQDDRASLQLLLELCLDLSDTVLETDPNSPGKFLSLSPVTNYIVKARDICSSLLLNEHIGPTASAKIYFQTRTDLLLSLLSIELDYVYLSNVFEEWFKGDKRDEMHFTDEIFCFNQILALFQKQSYLATGMNQSANCKAKFVLSENDCQKSNDRIAKNEPNAHVAEVLYYAQQKISELLYRAFPNGVPSLKDSNLFFGPGTNTSLRKTGPFNLRKKLGAPLSCSPNNIPILGEILLSSAALCQLNDTGIDPDSFNVPVNIVAAEYDEVPKNWKEHRGMVVEPSLAGAAQRIMGRAIRTALLLDGCNLFDQSHNQKCAEYASYDRENRWCNDQVVVTVDKTRASDTMSRECVWSMLPYEWVSRLDELRSPIVLMNDDSVIQLQKFSSMGNGFTFELESLIFWGVLHGSMKTLKVKPSVYNHSVYGDDIICPAKCYLLYKETVEYLGFSINNEKTSIRGYFRESCGCDYFFGYNVRPFFHKTKVSPRTLFSFYNFMIRAGHLDMASKIYDKIVTLFPKDQILWGPNGYGDGHLIGSWTPISNRSARRSGWEVTGFKTYSLTKNSISDPFKGDEILPPYSIHQKFETGLTTDLDDNKHLSDADLSVIDPDVCRGVATDDDGWMLYSVKTITTFKKTVF
ncbi:RNA-directed RNA polymerase [ssRNA phage SRR6960509_6]|uniref:RNA-directed RNA polymerase n=1 Tax=ssRNA phage SRR6960509_6 TaxID=2786533 RepID=A0A8S5L0L9_9VIRU|nr:RNA-directed RNA polymerase [ssRNA phage SRR6960509_6]DAD50972.1 TPA_asm: RNA-directed RNA polymerase [ssRNA phage SRR6960509_6]